MSILVTLFGISASPAHFEFPVTTLFVIVKVPLVLQSIGPSAAALIIVRPFHVVAVPKPSAAKLTFTTRSALVLLNALRPIVGASPAKASDSNAVALLNAQVAIEATLFGMVIEVSEVALLNAYSPIEVTLFGMVIAVSDLAPSNALLPIEVRELPAAKDTVWRALASANARLPIEVTVFGIAADPAQFVFPVTTLFVDLAGRLWIGSKGDGVSVLESGQFRKMDRSNAIFGDESAPANPLTHHTLQTYYRLREFT